MDKNKKIIAIAVFVVFITAIGLYAKFSLFASEEEEDPEFSITVPEVNEEDLDSVSKLDGYDKDLIRNRKLDDEEIVERIEEDGKKKGSEYVFNPFKRNNPGDSLAVSQDAFERMRQEEQLKAKEELELLLKMQEEMSEQLRDPEPVPEDNYYQSVPTTQVTSVSETSALEEVPPPTLAEKWSEQSERKNPFKGVGGFSGSGEILDLSPAETVDQAIIIAGSTIAIRLKRFLFVPESNITIPKDAVLYGKASFNDKNRLNIDISSYKTNKKLYPVSLAIYDFDGREGVHLGTNTWPKVPGKVAKEVFRFVKQRGTNVSALGGGNDIDAEQVRTVALLSTINEVLDELVNRRRVFMPKKYHLWINVVQEQN
ncbi:conjugative transposon protein TraM [Ascidiimonas sp. W6]|uniref:conjugative transposon protein TraM n=1 Tax=Ascidiimonas meishanensis TaxID=3128903 RepID=UPI0030EDAB2C